MFVHAFIYHMTVFTVNYNFKAWHFNQITRETFLLLFKKKNHLIFLTQFGNFLIEKPDLATLITTNILVLNKSSFTIEIQKTSE